MNKGLIEQVARRKKSIALPRRALSPRSSALQINSWEWLPARIRSFVRISNCCHWRLKNFTDGQEVVALVRPGEYPDPDGTAATQGLECFAGIVETITFHGAITRLGVNVSGQRVVADVTVANTKPVSLNQKIWLLFPAERLSGNGCQRMIFINAHELVLDKAGEVSKPGPPTTASSDRPWTSSGTVPSIQPMGCPGICSTPVSGPTRCARLLA